MEISIRDWIRTDLKQIQQTWLEYFRSVARPDMFLRANAEATMKQWLSDRFHQPECIGFVAESQEAFAGFLIGRIDNWESVPPVIEPRRIGIIDAVYVRKDLRKQEIGSRLIDRAIERMRKANAIAVETTYEAWNDSSNQVWHRAGFAPWMVHAYRIL
jgi:GNAT superfamily N-acetyltransferase